MGQLRQTVLTCEPAFKSANGISFFDFLARHRDASKWFDGGLANFAAPENAAILGAYDFTPFQRIVDVGGGQGGLLAQILKSYPLVTATLYDRPEVVHEPAHLIEAGIVDRCQMVGGNFFESVPAGGDAYLLKRILYDWSDDDCLQILHRCREVMNEKTRILVIDAVIPQGNDPHPAKVMDILMMALVEGRERTETEFRDLYRRAGFRLTRVVPTASVLAIVEGEKA